MWTEQTMLSVFRHLNTWLAVMAMVKVAVSYQDQSFELSMNSNFTNTEDTNGTLITDQPRSQINSSWFKDLVNRGRGLYIDDQTDSLGHVRQGIYNFYNINQRPSPPYYRPPLAPPSYDPYDYYYAYPPYNQPYYNRPYVPDLPTTPTSTTTTSAPPPAVINPIGYMLVDNYKTPLGQYSRPLAFFKS